MTYQEDSMIRYLSTALLIALLIGAGRAAAQVPPVPLKDPMPPVPTSPRASVRPARSPVPIRDPHAAGYVAAKELPDGAIPPANADGNFIIGPTHSLAPEMKEDASVPQGMV